MTTEAQEITYDAVLRMALCLQPAEQARLHTALAPDATQERAAQRKKNQAAIELLDKWASGADTNDEEGEDWDEVLRSIDEHRYSTRLLFPELHVAATE